VDTHSTSEQARKESVSRGVVDGALWPFLRAPKPRFARVCACVCVRPRGCSRIQHGGPVRGPAGRPLHCACAAAPGRRAAPRRVPRPGRHHGQHLRCATQHAIACAPRSRSSRRMRTGPYRRPMGPGGGGGGGPPRPAGGPPRPAGGGGAPRPGGSTFTPRPGGATFTPRPPSGPGGAPPSRVGGRPFVRRDQGPPPPPMNEFIRCALSRRTAPHHPRRAHAFALLAACPTFAWLTRTRRCWACSPARRR
jgi:hypothetical protein